ncbi:MAG: hypothetical protein L0Y64_03130 [Myxococcaceae bacterium]|nr:hypothetical protein [Myxococcaceae bacterium]
MAHRERELRDTLERLQVELSEANQALTESRAEVARLQQQSALAREERAQSEAALAAANARARDADAAFQHAIARLEQNRRGRKSLSSASRSGETQQPTGPRWNHGIPPDRLELGIRLGCGVAAGAIAGFYLASRLRLVSGLATAGVVVTMALVVGGLSRWFGDGFWSGWLSSMGRGRWRT